MTDRSDLKTRYAEREPLLEGLAANLATALAEQLEDIAHVDRVGFRVKAADSFVEKVLDRRTDPPYTDPLTEVEDQVAGRILVFFVDDVGPVQNAIEALLSPVETQHRQPERSNEFDYESFHGVYCFPPHLLPEGWEQLTDPPETFELQIRTLFQHAYAEPQHDVAYKARVALEAIDKRELAWIAASAWGADQAIVRIRDRLESRLLEDPAASN